MYSNEIGLSKPTYPGYLELWFFSLLLKSCTVSGSVNPSDSLASVQHFLCAFFCSPCFLSSLQRKMQQPPQHQHGHIFIKDLRPSAQNNVNTTFIVLEKGSSSRSDGGGQLLSINLVSDQTASVHLQLWGNECEAFQPGDIVRLTNGMFSFHKANGFALRAGKKGKLEKVGEFTMVFVESPNMSKIQWLQDPSNPSVWSPVGLNNQQFTQGFHGSSVPAPSIHRTSHHDRV